MDAFEPGTGVRINERGDWPAPPGFRFADARGLSTSWLEFAEVLQGFSDFVYVSIEAGGESATAYVGDKLCFRKSEVERL